MLLSLFEMNNKTRLSDSQSVLHAILMQCHLPVYTHLPMFARFWPRWSFAFKMKIHNKVAHVVAASLADHICQINSY